MISPRHVLAVSVLLLGAERAFAQSPLDLLPQDAAAALAIRDLDDLMKKGDKFLADTDIRNTTRPSDLFNQANAFLGVNKGLNRKGSAAIVLMSPEKAAKNLGLNDLETLLVPVIPFTDADTMAENFGIAKGRLLRNEVRKTENAKFGKFAARTQSHLYLSNSDKTLLRLLGSKLVSESLTPAQRKQFNESDILLHFGRYLWTMEDDSLPKFIAGKVKPGNDPQEKLFAELFAKNLTEVQNGIVGFRLDDAGIDGHFVATVPKDAQAAKLLAFLRGKRKSSTLRGLPEGNVLFAQASSGDSAQHALLAKSLFHFVLEDLLVQQQFVANTDMLNYLGVFQEVWSRLEGNRVAVYQNVNEPKLGLFTSVAILDSDDPHGFLREMRTLAKMAVADTLDFSKQEIKDEIDIDRLVRDLGSAAYRTRHSAATKLALIGEPSLPHLRKAIDSKQLDLETLRRSQDLRQRIGDVAAARRKELLQKKNQPLFLRPQLTFVTAAEKRQGQSIDAIHVKIAGLEKADQQKRYTQLLGPDWDKIRIAVVGKQIVAMLGSDVELFDAAIRNLQKGDAGLAATKRLAAFHERGAQHRLFEFHISVEGIVRLVTQNAKLGTPLQLTSASLSLGDTFVQLDARVPTTEIRAIAKKAQEGTR